MGCNCKNKNNPNTSTNETTPTPPPAQQQEITFRKEEVPQQSAIKQKLTMIQSFAMAIKSRGLNNEKVTKPIKQLRVLSCFGNKAQGGVLPPCEHLKNSTATVGKYFCGGCGCGDRKGTWLVADGDEYSKLDYPKLNCPLSMPGFSNYEKSKEDEGVAPVTRRFYIEQLPYKDIEIIPVTMHDIPIKPQTTVTDN